MKIIIWMLLICVSQLKADTVSGKIYFTSKDKRNETNIMVPSFLLGDIASSLNQGEAIELASKPYVCGYLSELIQKITQNKTHSYSVVRDRWYRLGARLAEKHGLALKGNQMDYSTLKQFGFVRCQIEAKYSIDDTISDDAKTYYACIYTTKKRKKELVEKSNAAGQMPIKVTLTGWISPASEYMIKDGIYTRIFVAE